MNVAGVLALLVATSTAHAEESGAPPATSRVEAYWSQTLIPDAIATSFVCFAILGISGGEVAPFSPVLAVAGGLTYALGAPLIHGARNNNGPAFASLGLRVALPLAGAWIGARADDREASNRGLNLGLLAGIVTAVVIDHTLLARQTIEVAPQRWSPTVVATDRGLALGLSAPF